MFKFIATVIETAANKKEVIINLVRVARVTVKKVAESAIEFADPVALGAITGLEFLNNWMVKAVEMAASLRSRKVKEMAETVKKVADKVIPAVIKGVQVVTETVKKYAAKVVKLCSWFETAFA